MGNCFLHGNGGGAALNFKVVRYASEADLPETAKENTIAFFSDIEMSGYIFSPVEPTAPEEGMVWFLTGASSTVAFNALKKNGVMVCPISAKQYVDGELVDVTAKSYQDDEWVDWWNGELFSNGNQFEYITGGWESTNACTNTNSRKAPTLEFSDGKMKITMTGSSNYTNGTVATVNEIDLTNFSQLVFSCTAESKAQYSGMTYATIGVMASTAATYSFAVSMKPSVGDNVLDVSQITGKHKIAINPMVSGETQYLEFDEIRMIA